MSIKRIPNRLAIRLEAGRIDPVEPTRWFNFSIGALWLKPEFHHVALGTKLTVLNCGPVGIAYLRP